MNKAFWEDSTLEIISKEECAEEEEIRRNSIDIELPYRYTPREYQKDLFLHMFDTDIKKDRFCVIWHRRAGKDKTFFQIAIMSTQAEKGIYWYMLPTNIQARRVIWQGMGKDGNKFLDHIPPEIIKRVNNTEMYVEFKNGSMLYVVGSDNYDSLVGSNPKGVVFSEWSLCNPIAWDYIRPILAENNGWAMFCYTPRGRNHGYSLYISAKNNRDRWFCSLLTVDDTKDEFGNPVISKKIIEQERLDGMSEDMIQQEFYCSFDAAVQGCYFANEIKEAYADNRICRVPIEKSLPVYTFWDLGISDDMAIWFMQPFAKELRLIQCYSHSGEGIAHYIQYLDDFAKKHNIRYAEHFAPHDIEVRELTTGESRKDTAAKMGLKFKTVPRVKMKADSINALRAIFPRLIFDIERCETGISAIASYHREYDEKKKIFRDKPEHDWSSNLSDALQQLAISWKDLDKKTKKLETRHTSSGGWLGG